MFTKHWWPSAAAAVICVAQLGLAQNQPPGEPPAQEGQPAQPAPAAEQPQIRVELLDQGAEPRRELRYQPQVGQAERATVEMRMTSAASMNGQQMPEQKLPATTLVMRMTPQRQTEQGIEYSFAFEQARVEPGHQLSDAVRQSIEPLVGARGVGVTSLRGESLSFELEGLDDLSEMMRAQIDSMSSQASQLGLVLPQEPVGVGAQWRVTMRLTNGGMEMRQISIATLKSLEEGNLVIALDLEQTAEPQEFEPPQMRGMTVKLLSLDGAGSGEMTVDLRRLAPVRSTISTDTTMRMSMNMGGEQTLSQKMSVMMSARGELAEDGPDAPAEPAPDREGGR